MPPKGRKDVDEADLPQIDRSLVKLRLLGVDKPLQAEIKARIAKSKRKDLIIISRDKILEYAEANGLYINPDTWDIKKKLPEGVPTVLTEELTIDLYDCTDQGTRSSSKNKTSWADNTSCSVSKQKKPAKTPHSTLASSKTLKKTRRRKTPKYFRLTRRLKRSKKKSPKKSDTREEETTCTCCLTNSKTKTRCTTSKTSKDSLSSTSRCKDSTTANTNSRSTQTVDAPDADILRKQIKDSKGFVSDLKRRLDEYVLNAEWKPEKDKEHSDLERIERELRLYETYIRQNLSHKSVWSWHCRYITWNLDDLKAVDPAVHWAYHMREKLIEAVSVDSILWRSYFDWLCSLDVVKVTAEAPVLYLKSKELQAEKERIQKLKEEQARIAEEEKNKKGAKGAPKPDPKKDPPKKADKQTTKPTKDPLKPPDKPEEDLQKSMLFKSRPDHPKIDPPKPTKWRVFEVIEKQMKHLTIEYLTGGAYLESFADEIEARSEGGLTSKVEPRISDQSLYSYLDDVFESLLSAK